MKKLKVLGPGCTRCDRLAASVEQAAKTLGIVYELEKIKEVQEYPSYGLMKTPGLVVDGRLVVQGRVPSVDELEALLG